jgi:hypothetical protein
VAQATRANEQLATCPTPRSPDAATVASVLAPGSGDENQKIDDIQHEKYKINILIREIE